jgi:translation initiation factor 1
MAFQPADFKSAASTRFATGAMSSLSSRRLPRPPAILHRVKKSIERRSLPGDGIVRIARETQGRGGRGVTVLTGLALPPQHLETLARELKALCGAGGAVRSGRIELQGEHRDRLVAELARRGFKTKRSGG